MSNIHFKCRKCREVLFTGEDLVTAREGAIDNRLLTLEDCDGLAEKCVNTLWYMNSEKPPAWIYEAIEQGQWTKGKLNCPKCGGRLGTFDFLTPGQCSCGEHITPSIRIAKNRVDLKHPGMITPPTCSPSHQAVQLHSLQPQINSDTSLEVGTTLTTDEREMDQLLGDIGKEKKSEEPVDTEPSDLDRFDSAAVDQSDNTESSLSQTVRQNNQRVMFYDTSTQQHQSNDKAEHQNAAGVGNQQTTSNGTAVSTTDHQMVPMSNGNRYQPLHALDEEEKSEHQQEKDKGDGETEVECGQDQLEGWTCSICLDLLYQAQLCFPCKHTFCAPCLRRLHSSIPIKTRCPLCREVITKCRTDQELNNAIVSVFPTEYKMRRKMERSSKGCKFPLPGEKGPLSLSRLGSRRPAAEHLTRFSMACSVILVLAGGFAVLCVTAFYVMLYMWENLVTVLDAMNDLLDRTWEVLAIFLLGGTVTPEMQEILATSVGRTIQALGELFRRINDTFPDDVHHYISQKAEGLPKMTQANVANYVILGCFMGYVVYRAARYMQIPHRWR